MRFLPTTYNAQPATALKSNTPRRQERAATPLAEGILDQKRKSSCSFRRFASRFLVRKAKTRDEERRGENSRPLVSVANSRCSFSRVFLSFSSRERSERLDNALSRLLPTTHTNNRPQVHTPHRKRSPPLKRGLRSRTSRSAREAELARLGEPEARGKRSEV